MPRPPSLSLLLVLSCCAPPPVPAPADLAENLRWQWLNAADADDAALLDGLTALSAAARADDRTAPLKGQLPLRLSREDLAPAGLQQGEDPARARGLLLLNPLPGCTLATVASLLSAAQQDVHPDLYDAYARTFDGDEAAFLAGQSQQLAWDAQFEARLPMEDRYTAEVRGELRRVGGRALVLRSWLKAPARFAPGSQSRFPQDYGVRLFFEAPAGRLFHAQGTWRELHVGALGLSTEDDGVFIPMLDRLMALNAELDRACGG